MLHSADTGERDQAILLTRQERDAVLGLGIRPTYSLDSCAAYEGDVQLMLANAALWAQAARITNAGRSGLMPPELLAPITALLELALPEAREELEQTTRDRDRWRAGDADRSFAGLGAEATESRYADDIARDRHRVHGLTSLAAKLHRVG